jgi:hypothetical protein
VTGPDGQTAPENDFAKPRCSSVGEVAWRIRLDWREEHEEREKLTEVPGADRPPFLDIAPLVPIPHGLGAG